MEREYIIKELIKSSGQSNRAFAEQAGIPSTTLQSMLTRGIGNASVDNVLKVLKELGITYEQLEIMANEDSIETIAAHHDGEDWTPEELDEIEKFKLFVKSKRDDSK